MKVELINYTPNPDKTCAAAAMSCQSKKTPKEIFDTISDDKIRKVLKSTSDKGHDSVIEHASFTFSISGVSRALTHQLVRHRIASFLQQSQRSVKIDKPDYVIPPSIESSKDILSEYKTFMEKTWEFYNRLQENGVPAEDARFVLPNASSSNIIITMNARSLMNFFELRCCMTSQWEIRKMAWAMLKEVKKVAPIIFEKAGPLCKNCKETDFICEIRNKKNHLKITEE